MRHRTSTTTTTLALTGLLSSAALAVAVAPALTPPAEVAPSTAEASAHVALTLTEVRSDLDALESEADRAGLAAQRADEALVQHDTSTTRAAADRAHDALVTLAAEQAPELTRLGDRATELGAAPQALSGTTATVAGLVGRTKAVRAVSYARAQLGDAYGYAAAGPGRWDCSGLTMKSYRAVKVAIGGHSATAQWRTAKAEHRLHSYSNRKVGDILFYGSPGAVYHVAIYSGHGKMIEAPYPGKRVREVPVRSSGRLSQVARPA